MITYMNSCTHSDWSRFKDWEHRLDKEDYKYLVRFVENLKNEVMNDEVLLLCGESKTGKTTLMEQLHNRFGSRVVTIDESRIKEVSGEECGRWSYFLARNRPSIVASVLTLDGIQPSMLADCRVINLNHQFS